MNSGIIAGIFLGKVPQKYVRGFFGFETKKLSVSDQLHSKVTNQSHFHSLSKQNPEIRVVCVWRPDNFGPSNDYANQAQYRHFVHHLGNTRLMTGPWPHRRSCQSIANSSILSLLYLDQLQKIELIEWPSGHFCMSIAHR